MVDEKLSGVKPKNVKHAILILRGLVGNTIKKDAEADLGKATYRYATLANVYETIMPYAQQLGLLIMATPKVIDGKNFILITCCLPEVGGDEFSFGVPLLLTGKKSKDWKSGVTTEAEPDMQSLGSAYTYATRYGMMMVAGLAAADDDGAAAVAAMAPPKMADPQQIQTIKRAAQETGADFDALLKTYKIQSLADMTFDMARDCISRLAKKKTKIEAEKAARPQPLDITPDEIPF